MHKCAETQADGWVLEDESSKHPIVLKLSHHLSLRYLVRSPLLG